jgi:hypothetical protein
VFPILLVIPGLIALALFSKELGEPGADWDGNRVLPMLVVRLLPPGVLGLVMGAFFAGVMSNLDSYVNSASTMIVTDIYRPYLRPRASDRECLVLGRWLVAALLLGGVAISYPIKPGSARSSRRSRLSVVLPGPAAGSAVDGNADAPRHAVGRSRRHAHRRRHLDHPHLGGMVVRDGGRDPVPVGGVVVFCGGPGFRGLRSARLHGRTHRTACAAWSAGYRPGSGPSSSSSPKSPSMPGGDER